MVRLRRRPAILKWCNDRMGKAATELHDFLIGLAKTARPGERLPAIRELMRRFQVSQVVVERLFSELKSRGLIASQVGRGTFFSGGDASGLPTKASEGRAAAPEARAEQRSASRSVLLLRRSISIARGRMLLDGLQRRFAADGHRVLEVAYTDPDHARLVLNGLPQLDACVVQSTFKTITVDLLADLRSKCDVLAVDGAALTGTDVEVVGMEWGEPLEEAIDVLRRRGHRRIMYASTAFPFLAGQMGQRRFEHLQKRLDGVELMKLTVPELPHEGYAEALVALVVEQLKRDPFTGLVAWGIEDGAKFRDLLAAAGVVVPVHLSVVLLGRTDLASEHAGYFHTVGCQVSDQVNELYEAVNARWANPTAPYVVRLIPVTSREGESVSEPFKVKAPGGEGPARARRGATSPA
jgi:DNA-binding LacI/PurR family transcriptional regulator